MAVALTYPVRTPQWVIHYAGKNISADVSAMVLSITYTDHLGGAANDVEVEFEDRERKWRGPWLPAQGDLLSLQIGYGGETLLPCGDFQADELEAQGPPDTFHLRCISAFITPAMRTHNSAGFENQTLLQIATAIAAKHGMSVVGAPSQSNISFARKTQKHETDLGFLHRISREYNYDFKVEGKKVVFYARVALEAQAPVITIQRTSTEHWRFKTVAHHVYKAAQIQWQDAQSKALITQTVQASSAVATGDTMVIRKRCETGQDAMARARAELHGANLMMVTGSLTLPGTTVLVPGNNVMMAGFGSFDGKYMIRQARHRLERAQGYTTEIDVRSVA